ncbi:MAG: alpha/beta fold hydrolase [Parvibaculales bacterium]
MTLSTSASAQTPDFIAEVQVEPGWTVQARDLMPDGQLHLLTMQDGVTVRVGVFRPVTAPKASLVLMTGYSEFIEKYFDTIRDFVDRGYLVVLPEWRGHGKSGGRLDNAPMRLHVRDFDQYRRDLFHVMAWLGTLDLPPLVFGLAHSMGGQIALRAVHERPDLFAALALSAPMIDVHVDGFEMALLKTLGRVYVALGRGDAAVLGDKKSRVGKTHDLNQVTNNHARFTLNEGMIMADFAINVEGRSVEWTLRAVQAMEATRRPEFLNTVSMPLFVGVADEDLLVRSQATLEAVKHMGNAVAQVYAPAKHELLMEVPAIRDRFISDVDAHFEKHRD